MKARQMALGGMMTAVCVVIMTLGSVIPVNTYICPVLCILALRVVLERCGRKTGWCCYMATAILALLLAPDREAALVCAFLGYYPMIRDRFRRTGIIGKLVFFTLAGAASYGMLLAIMGAQAAMTEGWLMTVVTVILWDVLFLLVDRLLGVPLKKR
jgi:hypothetical protein